MTPFPILYQTELTIADSLVRVQSLSSHRLIFQTICHQMPNLFSIGEFSLWQIPLRPYWMKQEPGWKIWLGQSLFTMKTLISGTIQREKPPAGLFIGLKMRQEI